LELFYPKGSSFFHRLQQFYGDDKQIDLADLGRVGSFTIAQLWAHGKHTAEQEALFAELVRLCDDPAERVRLQAAYYLSLLKDERSEPLVERTRKKVQMDRLYAAPEHLVKDLWAVGPFDFDERGARRFGPEVGQIDLTTSYDGRTWTEYHLPRDHAGAKETWYSYFRIVSGARQPAMLSVIASDDGQLWQNETQIGESIVVNGNAQAWNVDLQPGSNDFLVRTSRALYIPPLVKAVAKVESVLPEKLDSSLLAERLRSAAVGGAAQPVPVEFATVDWLSSSRDGDAAEGRKLFGTLGCAKCHAVVPDQKSAGAPSLFEAKKRFTVPHLVESVLLPSRQVAEPFRAQTFVTDDGRTLTGLVTGESETTVELLLPDAKRTTLYKKQIDDRTTTQLSPMPQGLVKTPAELRHLLSYLLSEKPLPP
jgi:putative heme-binding domain-containing protein